MGGGGCHKGSVGWLSLCLGKKHPAAEGWYVVVCVKDGEPKKFTFDHVFQGTQEELYDCIGKPMLQSAFGGYNTTLFAYGQTGSGKTHSVMGPRVHTVRCGENRIYFAFFSFAALLHKC